MLGSDLSFIIQLLLYIMKGAVILLAFVATAIAAPSNIKVSQKLIKSFEGGSRPNLIVSLTNTDEILASITAQATSMTHGQRATLVYNALKAHAEASQARILAILNSPQFFTSTHQSFWITNQIAVQGADISMLRALMSLDEVENISEEVLVRIDDPLSLPEHPSIQNEWNLEKIRAPEAWNFSGQGEGAIIGVIDTGARPTHEAIKDNFRGGTHSWFDPYLLSENPRDGHGHGTHVTGTAAGKFGIGVAPQAKWISCKGLNNLGIATQRALLRCGQFMTCPTDHREQNPDCTLAPHVVSNSWGGPGGQTFYDKVVAAWQAAGIIPVFAAGNSGPACYTIGSPSDSEAGAISVGATTRDDSIAGFSSRGPSNTLNSPKPDISSPGDQIRSAGIASDTEYVTFSGTSMACPHVAGLVALLKSQKKDANYDEIYSIITTTAVNDLTFGTSFCGGVSESVFPSHAFGHGRIDALAAVMAMKKH